jgi:pilus assembly protein Flp/PilA
LIKISAHFVAYTREERGQALIEYALILMLVAVVTVGALTALGQEVPDPILEVADALT